MKASGDDYARVWSKNLAKLHDSAVKECGFADADRLVEIILMETERRAWELIGRRSPNKPVPKPALRVVK